MYHLLMALSHQHDGVKLWLIIWTLLVALTQATCKQALILLSSPVKKIALLLTTWKNRVHGHELASPTHLRVHPRVPSMATVTQVSDLIGGTHASLFVFRDEAV